MAVAHLVRLCTDPESDQGPPEYLPAHAFISHIQRTEELFVVFCDHFFKKRKTRLISEIMKREGVWMSLQAPELKNEASVGVPKDPLLAT